MQSMRNGTPMLAASGYMSRLEVDLCIGCSVCVVSCPFGALELREDVVEVDQATCMGCGVCVSTCEVGALSLVRNQSASEPLEIQHLMAQARCP